MNQTSDFETIQLMLIKAQEKLKTAQIDFNNERYDDAVSRVYYGLPFNLGNSFI